MDEAIFTYEGKIIKIQCNKNQQMKDICKTLSIKINEDINSLIFLGQGVQLNLERKFNEITKENKIHILVYKIEEPTKGFNVKTISKDGFKLNVWDIGGQSAIRTYWENYYDRTDALVFVVDSSDDYRLDETTSVFKILLAELKLEPLPILVQLTKF